MDMTRSTILEGNINHELWTELVLAMTYVKNSRSTKALQNLSPYEALTRDHPNISHLRILGSTVYVFLHEEERSLKLEKWAPRALKETLIGYDGHTIYLVHIKEQNKVIRVKDLRIFEDYESKTATDLSNYNENTPTFQGFLLEDDNDDDKEESVQVHKNQKVNAEQLRESRKVNAEESCESQKVNMEQPCEGQKVNTEETHHITSTRGKDRKVKKAEHIPSTSTNHTFRSGCTVKLSAKAQETKNIADQEYLSPTEQSSEIKMHKLLSPPLQSSEIEKRKPLSPTEHKSSEIKKRKPLSPIERITEIENLVIQLTTLLDNWEKGPSVSIVTQSREDPTPEEEEDPMRILATKSIQQTMLIMINSQALLNLMLRNPRRVPERYRAHTLPSERE